MLGAPFASGTAAPLVFVLIALVVVAWALVGAHAWRAASRRRARLELPPGGGARDLLWLAPFAVVLGSGFWIAAGPASDPALALDAYLRDWRAGRVEDALARFAVAPGSATTLREAWERQDVSLRNAFVRIVASEPRMQLDPDNPIDGLRWLDLGPTDDGGRAFAAEVVREEVVRGELFGMLPTTSRRQVAVARLGVATLGRAAGDWAGPLGRATAWRVLDVELAGARVMPRR